MKKMRTVIQYFKLEFETNVKAEEDWEWHCSAQNQSEKPIRIVTMVHTVLLRQL